VKDASDTSKNPKRVAAGRRNARLRGGWTAEQRTAAKRRAQLHRPWEHSTGPCTPEGKAKAAENGRYAQQGDTSIRQVRNELGDTRGLVAEMRRLRGRV